MQQRQLASLHRVVPGDQLAMARRTLLRACRARLTGRADAAGRAVAVALSKVPECGDGVCSASESVVNSTTSVAACSTDCPFPARSCPYPGVNSVSDPQQVRPVHIYVRRSRASVRALWMCTPQRGTRRAMRCRHAMRSACCTCARQEAAIMLALLRH